MGWSGDIIIAASHQDKPLYGVQFHPEVDLTVNGTKVFESFLYKVKLFEFGKKKEQATFKACFILLDLWLSWPFQAKEQRRRMHRVH